LPKRGVEIKNRTSTRLPVFSAEKKHRKWDQTLGGRGGGRGGDGLFVKIQTLLINIGLGNMEKLFSVMVIPFGDFCWIDFDAKKKILQLQIKNLHYRTV
jgi:hypothetical protein